MPGVSHLMSAASIKGAMNPTEVHYTIVQGTPCGSRSFERPTEPLLVGMWGNDTDSEIFAFGVLVSNSRVDFVCNVGMDV